MQEVLRFEERDELLNLGLYSRRLRLQQPKMSKSDFSPPPRGGVFGPNLGVFDPPPGGGAKRDFFPKFREISLNFPKICPRKPRKTPPQLELGGGIFHFFSLFFENFEKFDKFHTFPTFSKNFRSPPRGLSRKTSKSATIP